MWSVALPSSGAAVTLILSWAPLGLPMASRLAAGVPSTFRTSVVPAGPSQWQNERSDKMRQAMQLS